MDGLTFSFDALERRLREIPDGPSAVLNTPRWVLPFNLAGCVGILLGLLPSALILFMTPAAWMVWMAEGGLYLALAGFAPGLLRSGVVIAVSLWHWRSEQVRQLDHDLASFRELKDWLSQFSADSRMDALRFVRLCRERLSSKLGLFAGSLEKLGVLPVAAGAALQFKAWQGGIGDVPPWQAMIALFFVLSYALGLAGALMRLRLGLYDAVLEESLISCEPRPAGAAAPLLSVSAPLQ